MCRGIIATSRSGIRRHLGNHPGQRTALSEIRMPEHPPFKRLRKPHHSSPVRKRVHAWERPAPLPRYPGEGRKRHRSAGQRVNFSEHT